MGYFDLFEPRDYKQAAREAVSAFREGERTAPATDAPAVYFGADAPGWIVDAVREASEGRNCDWTSDAAASACVDLLEAAEDGEDAAEGAHRWADTRVIYHADNARWYAHAHLARCYIGEVDRDALGGVADAVTLGHFAHCVAVYEAMHRAITERAEEVAREREEAAEDAANAAACEPGIDGGTL